MLARPWLLLTLCWNYNWYQQRVLLEKVSKIAHLLFWNYFHQKNCTIRESAFLYLMKIFFFSNFSHLGIFFCEITFSNQDIENMIIYSSYKFFHIFTLVKYFLDCFPELFWDLFFNILKLPLIYFYLRNI